jgi:hypothetical protein
MKIAYPFSVSQHAKDPSGSQLMILASIIETIYILIQLKQFCLKGKKDKKRIGGGEEWTQGQRGGSKYVLCCSWVGTLIPSSRPFSLPCIQLLVNILRHDSHHASQFVPDACPVIQLDQKDSE